MAGLVVVEPGISTASFKEWGEGKVRLLFTVEISFQQIIHLFIYLFIYLFGWCAVSYVHNYTKLLSAIITNLMPLSAGMSLWKIIFCWYFIL